MGLYPNVLKLVRPPTKYAKVNAKTSIYPSIIPSDKAWHVCLCLGFEFCGGKKRCMYALARVQQRPTSHEPHPTLNQPPKVAGGALAVDSSARELKFFVRTHAGAGVDGSSGGSGSSSSLASYVVVVMMGGISTWHPPRPTPTS